jgi:hypothetical protein
MDVILCRMRAGARRFAMGILLPIAACGGDDLFLPDAPDDRTPVQLRAYSGGGQSALVGSPVPYPLVVEALDGKGRPVQGAVVVFEFVDPPNGAAIAPPATQTGANGLAAAVVTLGTPAGEQPVDARLDDPARDLSVRFLLTAIRSNSGGGGGNDDPPPDDGGGGGGGGGGNAGPPDEGGGGGGPPPDDGGGGGGNGKGNGGGNGGGNGNGHDDEDD